MLKRLTRAHFVQVLLGRAAALYLRLVRATSRLEFHPPDIIKRADHELPIIIAFWHGEHFLAPFIKRPTDRVKVLISRHRDGEINAIAAEALGVGTIRGSGGHGATNLDKRGTAAFLEMVGALRDGYTVALTADVPKIARVAGLGVVMLAKHSGRSIYPAGVATSRRKTVQSSWDKSKIPLPFGRIVIAGGEPIRVPADADTAALEAARRQVEVGVEAATRRAYALADGRAG